MNISESELICEDNTDEYVEIIYNFGIRERIKWNEIRNISLMGSWIGKVGGLPHYVISYPKKEKGLFFAVGEIPKTRKTEKLIKNILQRKFHISIDFILSVA